MTNDMPLLPSWFPTPSAHFFTPRETQLLDAIFSRILPADHARQIPGAVEAGATGFLSRLLALSASVYEEIPAWQALYRSALPVLSAHATASFGHDLDGLTDDQMNQILAGLENGALAGLPSMLNQKVLFTMLRRHCIQGCLVDPRWGGNPDKIMWRALGYLQPAEDLYHD